MNKVYIVTSGEYSDYSIDAVFASREKAEAYIKAKNGGEHTEFEHDEWDTQTNHNIETWDIGDEYVDAAYWVIASSIYTTLSWEERTIDIVVCGLNGVDALRGEGTSGSIRIYQYPLYNPYNGRGYQINARYCIPKNRLTTKSEVEEHYKKVMRDLLAKIKYMVEVEGMTIKEVENSINGKEGNE